LKNQRQGLGECCSIFHDAEYFGTDSAIFRDSAIYLLVWILRFYDSRIFTFWVSDSFVFGDSFNRKMD
jgi:hypothetical protein